MKFKDRIAFTWSFWEIDTDRQTYIPHLCSGVTSRFRNNAAVCWIDHWMGGVEKCHGIKPARCMLISRKMTPKS